MSCAEHTRQIAPPANRAGVGDSFRAGDILMEVETDKAQMDVEAPDDGVLAKILTPSSADKVAVGQRIAVLAEPGDNLATLEIPPETKSQSTAFPSSKQDSPADQSRTTEASAQSTPKTGKTRTPHTPSPSVAHLLHAHGLSAANIKPTGPKGRLLKGDVLAHLGTIPASSPADLEQRLHVLAKLDLSNIKIAAPKPPSSPSSSSSTPAAASAPPKPTHADVELEIDFAAVRAVQDRLSAALGAGTGAGHLLPLSTFIARASSRAGTALPAPPTPDQIFDELVGLPPTSTGVARAWLPIVEAKHPPAAAPAAVTVHEADIIDVLAGNVPMPAAGPVVGGNGVGVAARGPNVMRLRVPAEEEARARVFLGRVKGLLEKEPAQLVL